MVGTNDIRLFEKYITNYRNAVADDISIGIIQITDEVTMELVYDINKYKIVQVLFQGVETDMMERFDGDFKSGQDEYPLILKMLESGRFTELMRNLPSTLTLTDGKTLANFRK